jgi:hypothetical protein
LIHMNAYPQDFFGRRRMSKNCSFLREARSSSSTGLLGISDEGVKQV